MGACDWNRVHPLPLQASAPDSVPSTTQPRFCHSSSGKRLRSMGVLYASHKHGIEKRMRWEFVQGNEELHHTNLLPKVASIVQVEGNDDLLHEILKHLDAKSLASASCVSRRWRKAAYDQRLWESICTRNWPAAVSRPHQLKSVVLALGGFRRLYTLCLRPLLSRPFNSPPQPLPFSLPRDNIPAACARQWSRDEVHLSLSLFSIDCFERLGRRSFSPVALGLLCKASSSEERSGICGLNN